MSNGDTGTVSRCAILAGWEHLNVRNWVSDVEGVRRRVEDEFLTIIFVFSRRLERTLQVVHLCLQFLKRPLNGAVSRCNANGTCSWLISWILLATLRVVGGH